MKRHCLVEQSDQGPIPMSTDSFETFHLKLRKFSLDDPWHLLWRSILNGLKQSNVWSIFVLGSIFLNYKEGPWSGQKWFQSVREAWCEFKKMAANNLQKDPLVKVVVERMERFGVEADELFQFLSDGNEPEFLHKKGGTVQPSRWWSWQDAMLDRLKRPVDIHIELLALLFSGISMGYLLNETTPVMCGLKYSDTDDLRGQARSASNLRSRCKNTLHAVTVSRYPLFMLLFFVCWLCTILIIYPILFHGFVLFGVWCILEPSIRGCLRMKHWFCRSWSMI